MFLPSAPFPLLSECCPAERLPTRPFNTLNADFVILQEIWSFSPSTRCPASTFARITLLLSPARPTLRPAGPSPTPPAVLPCSAPRARHRPPRRTRAPPRTQLETLARLLPARTETLIHTRARTGCLAPAGRPARVSSLKRPSGKHADEAIAARVASANAFARGASWHCVWPLPRRPRR
jgi:hypothetical protein